jgi:hypothetical protein
MGGGAPDGPGGPRAPSGGAGAPEGGDPLLAAVDRFVDGEMGPEERAAFEARLGADPALAEEVAAARAAKEAVASLPALRPEAGDWERALAAIRGAAPEGGGGARILPGPGARRRAPLLRGAAVAAGLAAFVGTLYVALAPAGASLSYAPGLFVRFRPSLPAETAWARPWPLPGEGAGAPPADLAGVPGALEADLSPAARRRLLETGVLWRPRPARAPRDPAEEARLAALPSVATLDAALVHAGAAIGEAESALEAEVVAPALLRLLDDLALALARDEREAPPASAEAYALARDLVETGRALARGAPAATPRAAAEVALVQAAEGPAPSPLSGALEDYGAFAGLRGNGPARAAAWLARPRLPLDEARGAAASLAVLHALLATGPLPGRARPIDRYERIRASQAFFRGAPVDWPPERLIPAVRALAGARLRLEAVTPEGPLAAALARLERPAIAGPAGARPFFSLLGWRWDAAARATAALTGPERLLGSGLDLLAAERFPGAREELLRVAGPAALPDLEARLGALARDLAREGCADDLFRIAAKVREAASEARQSPGETAPADAGSAEARAAREGRAIAQALATLDLARIATRAGAEARLPEAAAAPPLPAGVGTAPALVEPLPHAFALLGALARAVAIALRDGEPFPSREARALACEEAADLCLALARGDAGAARRLSRARLEGEGGVLAARAVNVVLGPEGRAVTMTRALVGPLEMLVLLPRPGAPGEWIVARGLALAPFEVPSERPGAPLAAALPGGLADLPAPPYLRSWREP